MRRIVIALYLLVASNQALADTALLLFGGREHDKFLGCLNCNSSASSSVCNAFGEFGNSFNSGSIWSGFGSYGNSFSSESPWNEYASYPPVIVDKDGKFYGYLTANQYNGKRTNIRALQKLAEYGAKNSSDLDKVRDAFCD
jgi:hypothetical protein